MRKKFLVLLLVLLPALGFAQQNVSVPQKFALVIGNGNYTGLSKLANPVNDANDMAAALTGLGFSVDKVLNGSLEQMESGIIKLKNRLAVNADSYGFLFYAGHGVQSGGENYLIPVDANIPGENFLRSRAVPVQLLLDELNDAHNSLNVVVLDACRDNPFGWGRSGTRGLTVVGRQPTDSIIVYATSAGQQASDGTGRNGLFTSQFLPNLTTPGIDVNEVFKRTGADVAEASGNKQIPAIYSQFFKTAYLGVTPDHAASLPARPAPMPVTPVDKGKAGKAAWGIGASLGTSFIEPWFIGTVRATFAPKGKSFFELGMDVGLVSGVADVGYHSFYPYVHFALLAPFAKAGGWYAGAGAGYLIATYNFPERTYPATVPAVDITTGFNIGNAFDISYTLRTNFAVANHKVAVGYTYRFK